MKDIYENIRDRIEIKVIRVIRVIPVSKQSLNVRALTVGRKVKVGRQR